MSNEDVKPLQEPAHGVGQAVVLPRYAGFWIRLGAAIIDGVILLVPAFIIAYIFAFAIVSSGRDTALFLILLMVGISIIGGWLYNAWFESSRHMGTPGKIFCGIKVTDLEGNRIGLGRATVRYFCKYGVISLLRLVNQYLTCVAFIYAVADVFLLIINEKKMSLHDMFAGTIVVYR